MDMFHSHQQRRATNSLQDRLLLVRPIPTASRFTWVTYFWKEVSERQSWRPRHKLPSPVIIITSHQIWSLANIAPFGVRERLAQLHLKISVSSAVKVSRHLFLQPVLVATRTKLLGLLQIKQSPLASGVFFIKENSDVTNHDGSLSTSRLPGSVPGYDQFLPTIQPVLVSYERVARVPSQESCDVQLNPLGHTPNNTHSLTVQIDVIALVIHNPLDRHQFGQ
ncbi:hypothetical protein PGTUg99_019980 [Puccinia graminis f. sp. tritici]|uniref:Uncharacterized protein n=1 Tax=Puccinia graminis f. sp. tritici TaxID=56615 RepID=A0A5B0SDX4_PUCGR|nr:hypothetical protein PGTUg99_019980 [Puccinia graminis f. sp. tritici]